MKRITVFIFSILSLSLFSQEEKKFYQEFELEFGLEYRFFLEDGLYENQKNHYPSFAIQPEYLLEWANGNQSIHFTGFYRWDIDSKRRHWDIRELYWQGLKNNFELSIGAKKVFWGVTESAHLVDVINQTDAVESFDGEQKLGQPMIHLSYFSNWGTFDFFGMTGFRKRAFSGEKGRFRTPFIIEKEDLGFQSDLEEWHPEFAFRWSNSLSIFDWGLSYFYGNGREPFFQQGEDGDFSVFYPLNHQVGLDLQATTGAWLFKLENIYRNNDFQDMVAFALGFEYTLGNIKDSGMDLGLIAEYLYDNRDELALSGLDNDLFIGSRLAFNDVQGTEFLVGGIIDLNRNSQFISLETNRRIGENWKVELEARILLNIAEEEFLSFFRNDSFLRFNLKRYF